MNFSKVAHLRACMRGR